MYLLHDLCFAPFAYKDPNYNKIIDKWIKVSKKTEPFNNTKAYHRQMMLDSMRDRQGLSLLKKEYRDTQGRKRKVVTGIMQAKEKPDRLVVNYLAGNPFSARDKRFRGALDTIEKKAGRRKIQIDPITPAVDKLYDDKFGYKRI